MRAAYPEAPEEADNDVREDGTACHWLAAEIWEGRHPALESLSPNQRELTEEMFDAVDLYHDVLRSWGVAAVCELTLTIDSILQGMKGTPDAWAWDAVKRRLYIADLKFGYRFVEVYENKQMAIYCRAILDHLGLLGNEDETITVVFTIVQPRSYHREGPVRKWVVQASDLRPLWNDLAEAAQRCFRPNAPCTPNPGCGDCPGRFSCMALQNSAMVALEASYGSVPFELPPAALGDELGRLRRARSHMEARITGLEAQAEQLLRDGTTVPGWALYPSYARERWREGSESQVLTLGTLYNVDLAKPAKPITPAQARKLLPANAVAVFAHKPSTGVKLSPVDPLEAKKAFSTKKE